MTRLIPFISRGRGQRSVSTPCEDTARRQLPANQEAGPHQTLNLLGPCSWTSQPPELWEINVCYINVPLYGFCYSSLN